MSWAFRLYVSGLIVCPLLMVFNDGASRALAGAFCLLLLLIVLVAIRPGEAKFGLGLLRPFLVLAGLPAIWIVIQTAPVPTALMTQLLPGWAGGNAEARSAWTTISVDPNASLVALVTYICAIALGVSATFLAIDRSRAERLLVLLAALTTIVALVLAIHDLGGFFFLGEITSVGPRATITSAAVVGVLFDAAVVVLVIERFETRRKRGQFAVSTAIGGLVASISAGALCLLTLILFSSQAAVFAAVTGLGAQLLITAFRRLGLSPRSGYLLAAIGVAVPLAFVAGHLSIASRDLTLRFDTQAPANILAAAQDAIASAPLLGFGAGSMKAVMSADVQIDGAHTMSATTSPTTMAGLTLELGRPVALLILAVAFAVAVLLIRSALKRGRDSFFPTLGAAAVLALSAEAFTDASLFSPTMIAINAAVLGLAIAQSTSRSQMS